MIQGAGWLHPELYLKKTGLIFSPVWVIYHLSNSSIGLYCIMGALSGTS